jgi:hypothetical protein
LSERLVTAAPTLAQFIRHAERFGPECVLETAGQIWWSELPSPVELTRLLPAEVDRVLDDRERIFAAYHDNVDRLRIELDALEAVRRGQSFTVGTRRRRSEIETARYAHALARELSETGLIRTVVEHRVADKLGLSDAYTRRMLKLGREMSGTPQNAPRKPSVQAESFATKPESDTGVPLADPAGRIA